MRASKQLFGAMDAQVGRSRPSVTRGHSRPALAASTHSRPARTRGHPPPPLPRPQNALLDSLTAVAPLTRTACKQRARGLQATRARLANARTCPASTCNFNLARRGPAAGCATCPTRTIGPDSLAADAGLLRAVRPPRARGGFRGGAPPGEGQPPARGGGRGGARRRVLLRRRGLAATRVARPLVHSCSRALVHLCSPPLAI